MKTNSRASPLVRRSLISLVTMVTMALSLCPSRANSEDRMVKCITSCRPGADSSTTCFYELKASCDKRQKICIESNEVDCKPVSVNLGSWAPRPAENAWKTQGYEY